MKKIIVFMLCCIPVFLFPSEARLSGMAGRSMTGLYMTPDIFCDALYNNPALAVLAGEKIINQSNYFRIKYEYFYQKIYDSYENFYFDSLNQIAFILPFSPLIFGFNLSVFFSKHSWNTDKYNLFTFDDSRFQFLNLQSGLLFAVPVSDHYALGFDAEIKGLLFYNYISNGFSMLESSSHYPINIEGRAGAGLFINYGGFKISIYTPFHFLYNQNIRNSRLYSLKDTDVENLSFIFIPGLKVLNEYRITDVFSLRLNSRFTFTIDNRGKKGEIRANYLHYELLNAFAVQFQITKTSFIFLGLDEGAKIYYLNNNELEYPQQARFQLTTGFFAGGEFSIIKWLILRAGISTYLLETNLYHDYEVIETEDFDTVRLLSGQDFYFLFHTKIDTGLTFRITKFFDLELNSDFLLINSQFKYLEIKETSDSFTGDNFDRSWNIDVHMGFNLRFHF